MLALLAAQASLSPRMPAALDKYYSFLEVQPALAVRWKEYGKGIGGKSFAAQGSKRLWLVKDGRLRLDLGTVARVWDGKKGMEWNRELKTWKPVGLDAFTSEAMLSFGLRRPRRIEAQEWGYLEGPLRLRWMLGPDAATQITWTLEGHRLVKLEKEDVTIAGPVSRTFEVIGFRRLRSVAADLFSTKPPKGYVREGSPRPKQ